MSNPLTALTPLAWLMMRTAQMAVAQHVVIDDFEVPHSRRPHAIQRTETLLC